jgi:hypothetical protein
MTQQTDDRPVRRDRSADKREAANPTRAQEPVREPVHGEDEDRPWVAPTHLAAPPVRPGYGQRWIRVAIRNEADVTNLSNSLRAGWVPRRADSAPADFPVPSIKHGEFVGAIGIHGMVLCEIPAGRIVAREKYIKDLTQKQTRAVARDLEEEAGHPSMPLSQERISKVMKGRQRTPQVGDDSVVPSQAPPARDPDDTDA